MTHEYVKHIRATHEDTKTWCGETIETLLGLPISSEFYFKDAEHAAQNGRVNGRLVACTKCVNQVISCLIPGDYIYALRRM